MSDRSVPRTYWRAGWAAVAAPAASANPRCSGESEGEAAASRGVGREAETRGEPLSGPAGPPSGVARGAPPAAEADGGAAWASSTPNPHGGNNPQATAVAGDGTSAPAAGKAVTGDGAEEDARAAKSPASARRAAARENRENRENRAPPSGLLDPNGGGLSAHSPFNVFKECSQSLSNQLK